MSQDVKQKNDFVIALRDHLKSSYGTKYHYTPGYDEFKALMDEPMDITGFYFRKDACDWVPTNEAKLLKDVYDYSSGKNIESILKNDRLIIRFGKTEYLVTSHIDGGYAGEFNVSFVELPNIKEITASL